MILAIDTATRWTGLALYDGRAVVAETGWRGGGTQTVALAPAISRVLQRARVSPEDLSGIAVAIGPGSYTGLRVGLGVAKGLSLAHQTPLVGVGTLDIVAHGIGPLEATLVVVAEAGRSRICAGVYAWRARQGWQAAAAPQILAWEALLPGLSGPTVFAGEISAAAAKTIRAADKAFRMALPSASTRRAACLAEIGWQRVRKRQVDMAAALAPVYLRDPAGN